MSTDVAGPRLYEEPPRHEVMYYKQTETDRQDNHNGHSLRSSNFARIRVQCISE